MVKYMDSVISRLKSLKTGMENNPALWNGLPETPASMQAKIDELVSKEKQLTDIQAQTKIIISESHSICDIGEKYADKIEALATGLHSETPEKLNEYNVAQRKKGTAVPKPTKVLIPVLEDDTDGVGFIISTQPDSDASNYQWFKGASAEPKNTNTVPDMQPFKISSKTTFVDDEVEKGVRYFYKVQAFNVRGVGPMSEPVSRIQQ